MLAFSLLLVSKMKQKFFKNIELLLRTIKEDDNCMTIISHRNYIKKTIRYDIYAKYHKYSFIWNPILKKSQSLPNSNQKRFISKFSFQNQ